jgi:TPR repeat protein
VAHSAGGVSVRRIARAVSRGAQGVAVLTALATLGVWLRYNSPFRSAESRARAAYGACVFGDREACALLPSVCAEGCAEGDFSACMDLAALYHTGQFVPRDARRANAVYAAACDHDYAPACYELGTRDEFGIGIEEDLPAARRVYRRACDLQHAAACTQLGLMVRDGRGGPENVGASVHLFEMACAHGEMHGCYQLGLAYAGGFGVVRDREHAETLLARACTVDRSVTCAGLAHLYLESPSLERVAQGMQLLERACAEDDRTACLTLGRAHLSHPRAERRPERAHPAFVKACELGEDAGCIMASHWNSATAPTETAP